MSLKQKIEELFKQKDNNFFEAMMYEDYNPSDFEGLTLKVVQQVGGEGQGDDYYTIYSFTVGDETVYVKFQGWYASYHGAEFSSWFFVEPKERVITVYKKV